MCLTGFIYVISCQCLLTSWVDFRRYFWGLCREGINILYIISSTSSYVSHPLVQRRVVYPQSES